MPSHRWLNNMMEIDHVIRINGDLSIDEHPLPYVYAPESIIGTDDDGQILAEDEKAWKDSLEHQGWEPIGGFSGQFGYSGPIMHASEFIAGDLAEYILDRPGLYVAVTVETLDDSEEAAGWAVLYRQIDLPHESYVCPCCGDGVMGTRPICDACDHAGCERSNDSGGDRAYFNCQRADMDEE